MTGRNPFLRRILLTGLAALSACRPAPDELKRIEILPNPILQAASRPTFLARNLNNPMSPRLIDGYVVFAQSGQGEVCRVSRTGGPVESLITGFAFDYFAGYKISAQCIAVDPATKQWIVCAAEGGGRGLAFTASRFPIDAASGREIALEGAVDDNPFDVVLPPGGRIIMSGGTAKAYGGVFRPDERMVLKPLFKVQTGITGLALDPKSGDVFGAVFGSGRDGSVIRFRPNLDQPSIKTVATGFANLVDVAFTSDGILLALEFGDLKNKQGQMDGTISIVSTNGDGKITPFVRGLSHPSGLSIANRDLFITEFGDVLNGQRGNLISIRLEGSRTGTDK